MKKIVILVVIVVITAGCTSTKDTDIDCTELVSEYESINQDLIDQIEKLEEEVDDLNSDLLPMQQELDRLNEEIMVLTAEEVEENKEYDLLIEELESYYNNILIRDDIPKPEYTFEELTDMYESVEDGVDLNTYGAYVSQIYFEVGIANFIQQVAALNDQEDKNLIALVFAYSIISFPDAYYVGEIPIEALQDSIERDFFNQLDEFTPSEEREVIHSIIFQVWATHSWFE